LSKIIKANNLIVVRGGDNEPQSLTEDTLTKENMAILYEEAKIMVEELIAEAKKRAEKIINEAKIEAQKVLDNTRKEVEEIKEIAYREGFAQGKEAGLLSVQELEKQANLLIEKAYGEREKILGEMENEIVDFAFKLAEKVIRNQVDNKPEVAKFIVQDLLSLVQDAARVTVKLSAAEYENLRSEEKELQAILSYGVLNLECDPTLNKGDCIVVSETGIVAAKIDDQLAKLREILREVTYSD